MSNPDRDARPPTGSGPAADTDLPGRAVGGHPDDPDRWRHGTVPVNGVDLHYVTVGPDDGATEQGLAVLLHGFPEFWYAWRHQLDALAARGYRVVAPDMRGYNRSTQPSGVDSYRPAELVADVRGLIDRFGYDRASVVGHDWGGAVAWEVAMRDPGRLDRLAILNAPHPAAYRRLLRRSPEQLLRSWYVLFFQVPWLPERLLAADGHRLVGEMLADTARPEAFTDADIDRYRAAMERSGSMAGPVNYYRATARETLRDGLAALVGRGSREETVAVPTLVIWGENDRALSVELLDGLGRWVSDLRIERLPGASHWVQADEPERVSDLLVEFL